MSGGNYNQGQPTGYPHNQHPNQQGYPPQQGQPPQHGYPPQQGYPPPGYPSNQPYGQAGYAPQQWAGGYAPPFTMPTEFFGGFWIRFVAYIIDALVLTIPSLLTSAGIMALFGFSPFIQYDFEAQMQVAQAGGYQVANNVSTLVQILIAWMYYAFMHSQKGATLGKMALGLRVVEANGMYPSFARATGRYFATILSACMCLIGYIWAGFHPQKRAIHDLIAGTWVLRKEYMNPVQIAEETNR